MSLLNRKGNSNCKHDYEKLTNSGFEGVFIFFWEYAKKEKLVCKKCGKELD